MNTQTHTQVYLLFYIGDTRIPLSAQKCRYLSEYNTNYICIFMGRFLTGGRKGDLMAPYDRRERNVKKRKEKRERTCRKEKERKKTREDMDLG